MKSIPFQGLLGFGDGQRPGEFFFSQGMTRTRRGIAPYWSSTSLATEGTLAQLSSELRWFAEVGSDIYGMDSNGDIFKSEVGLLAWAHAHANGQANNGNGLIGDQKGRLLYVGSRYLGMFDGTTWTDNWKDFGTDIDASGAVKVPTALYEDVVLFGRKNNVCRLNDDDTVNADATPAFELPSGFTIADICGGRTGILIGANVGRRGYLVLWDNYSDRSIAPWMQLEDPVLSIKPAFGQWLVVTDREAFLTNGYSKGQSWPIYEQTFLGSYIDILPQGALVVRDKLILANSSARYTRARSGFAILDLVTGLWDFVPVLNKQMKGLTMGALFSGGSVTRVHTSFATAKPDDKHIGWLLPTVPSAAYFITEPLGDGTSDKIAKEVQLQLAPYDKDDTTVALTFKVTPKVYDFSRPLWSIAFQKSGVGASFGLDSVTIDGTLGLAAAQVGDEVTILDGVYAGQVRHIASISGDGTATEKWFFDEDLTDPGGFPPMEDGAYFSVTPFRKLDTMEVSASTDLAAIPFNFSVTDSLKGKKFLVKVYLHDMTYGPVVEGGALLVEDLEQK